MKKNIILISFFTTIILFIPTFFLLTNLDFTNSFKCRQSNQPTALFDEYIVIQSLVPQKDSLSAISIKTATYNRTPLRGSILIKIKDDKNKTILEKTVPIRIMEDNRFFEIEIPNQTLQKGKKYYMEITYLEKPKEPIGFWNTQSDCYAGSLFVNSQEIENSDLILYLKYSKESFGENTKELLNRISQYKPIFFKDYKILFLFAIYFLLIFIFIFEATKRIIK